MASLAHVMVDELGVSGIITYSTAALVWLITELASNAAPHPVYAALGGLVVLVGTFPEIIGAADPDD